MLDQCVCGRAERPRKDPTWDSWHRTGLLSLDRGRRCSIPLSCPCILGWSVTRVKVHVGIENLRCQSVHSNWCCSGIGLNSINLGLQQNSLCEGTHKKMLILNPHQMTGVEPTSVCGEWTPSQLRAPCDKWCPFKRLNTGHNSSRCTNRPKLIHSNEIWARDKGANLALSWQPRPSALLCPC